MLCVLTMDTTLLLSTMVKTYSDLRRISTHLDRYRYLSLRGFVGDSTFGFDRWMNQEFYRSREWRRLRSDILLRDNGCDLGVEGFEIHDRPIIHHMNPMTSEDIIRSNEDNLNPEYLITVTHATHNAIHYGDESLLPRTLSVRTHGDTKLW